MHESADDKHGAKIRCAARLCFWAPSGVRRAGWAEWRVRKADTAAGLVWAGSTQVVAFIGLSRWVCRRDKCTKTHMAQRVANELLFVVPVAPVLLGRRTLAQTFVKNQLAQIAQVTEITNLVG